jgi:hypothetical protein
MSGLMKKIQADGMHGTGGKCERGTNIQPQCLKRHWPLTVWRMVAYWCIKTDHKQVLWWLINQFGAKIFVNKNINILVAWRLELDVRGSVHHSKIHKEKSNKMQQYIKILLFHIYMKLNMFRAIHRPSSRAKGSLWLYWLVFRQCLKKSTNHTSNNLPHMKNQRLPVQF